MKIAIAAVGLVALCCSASPATAQIEAKAVTKAIDDYMENVRSGQPLQTLPKALLTGNPKTVLESAAAHQSDPLPKVRHFATTLMRNTAKASTDPAIRQQAVGQLVSAMADPEPLVWQHAAKYLLEFREEDFDEATKAAVIENVRSESPRREDIRIAGLAQIASLLPRLGELLIDEGSVEDGDYAGRWYGTAGWAARLARARMGASGDAAHAVSVVEAEADDIVRVTVLLRDLAYVDQPSTLQVLRGYLSSVAVLPSAHPPKPGSPHYGYAIEALAEFGEGFPFEAQGGGYSEEDRRRALAWLDDRLQQ